MKLRKKNPVFPLQLSFGSGHRVDFGAQLQGHEEISLSRNLQQVLPKTVGSFLF